MYEPRDQIGIFRSVKEYCSEELMKVLIMRIRRALTAQKTNPTKPTTHLNQQQQQQWSSSSSEAHDSSSSSSSTIDEDQTQTPVESGGGEGGGERRRKRRRVSAVNSGGNDAAGNCNICKDSGDGSEKEKGKAGEEEKRERKMEVDGDNVKKSASLSSAAAVSIEKLLLLLKLMRIFSRVRTFLLFSTPFTSLFQITRFFLTSSSSSSSLALPLFLFFSSPLQRTINSSKQNICSFILRRSNRPRNNAYLLLRRINPRRILRRPSQPRPPRRRQRGDLHKRRHPSHA